MSVELVWTIVLGVIAIFLGVVATVQNIHLAVRIGMGQSRIPRVARVTNNL